MVSSNPAIFHIFPDTRIVYNSCGYFIEVYKKNKWILIKHILHDNINLSHTQELERVVEHMKETIEGNK